MLSVLLSLGLMAASQDPPRQDPGAQDPPTTRVEDVVVAGRRQTLEEAAVAFVTEVGGAPRWQNRARWEEPICIGAANIRADVAQAFIDHVAMVALAAGAEIAEPGCRANVLIIFADDADDVARAMVEGDRDDFLPNEGGASLGREALEAFMTSDRPVRWWLVNQAVSSHTGQPPILVTKRDADGAEYEVAEVVVERMSRIWSGMRNDLRRAVVIVDVTRTRGVDPTSLADYVALVALAQIDPDTDGAGFPSILSLFSGAPTSARLSEWDLNYLASLYDAPVGQRSAHIQRQHIARGMIRRVEGAEAP